MKSDVLVSIYKFRFILYLYILVLSLLQYLSLQVMWISSVLWWKWCQVIWADSESRVWIWLSVLGWHLRFRYNHLHDYKYLQRIQSEKFDSINMCFFVCLFVFFVHSQRLHLSPDGERPFEEIYMWAGPAASMVGKSTSVNDHKNWHSFTFNWAEMNHR